MESIELALGGEEGARAASEGAPQAVQVVDRWHILKNLIDYLERFLLHHTRLLKGAPRSWMGSNR